ncbi:MAG: Hsp20/alpha crystallin family protein [Bacillaceae bacterium]|nr:Hsp20/alpha crystallin family protein [Bacillaceae bacterium]
MVRYPRQGKRSEVDAWFNEMMDFRELFERFRQNRLYNVDQFSISVQDAGDYYLVQAGVPKMDPQNIQVFCESGSLIITGAHDEQTELKGQNIYRKSQNASRFTRQIYVGEDMDPSRMKIRHDQDRVRIKIYKR